MLNYENKTGKITIDDAVITSLAGSAATACFGVKGMVACAKDGGPWQILRGDSLSKGVAVRINDNESADIDLHIGIDKGVNIRTVAQSIMNEVTYKLKQTAGINISSVNVFIDTIVES